MKKFLFAASLCLVCSAGLAQGDVNLLSNNEIGEKIRSLASQGRETQKEQNNLIWVLVMRSVQGDKNAHSVGRAPAERLKEANDLDYRAKFAFGYFRHKEAYDTRDPVLRLRRLDEGRRAMLASLPVGNRDGDFLFDSGIVMANLSTDANLFKQAADKLTMAKRIFGTGWSDLSKERRADWYCAMGIALEKCGLEEMARDNYRAAYDLAPDSVSGRKALQWIRSKG